MTRSGLSLLALLLAACSGRDAKLPASDPNAPAVVKLPPPLVASDTAKKPPPPPVVDLEEAQHHLAGEYALLAFGMTGGKGGLLVDGYDPDAQLILPDTTVRGNKQIAMHLLSMMQARSVREFRRASNGISSVDSVFTDSGQFVGIGGRTGGNEVVEQGRYSTTWRYHGNGSWTILSDRLMPGAAAPRKKK